MGRMRRPHAQPAALADLYLGRLLCCRLLDPAASLADPV